MLYSWFAVAQKSQSQIFKNFSTQVVKHWYFETGYGESIFNVEITKCYKSSFPLFPWKAWELPEYKYVKYTYVKYKTPLNISM